MSRTVSIASPITSLLTALAALCVLALLPGTARAGAYTYSAGTGTQRTVNAGVLLLDGNISAGQNADPTGQGADDKDPYVFYILNQRIDVKPFGVEHRQPAGSALGHLYCVPALAKPHPRCRRADLSAWTDPHTGHGRLLGSAARCHGVFRPE